MPTKQRPTVPRRSAFIALLAAALSLQAVAEVQLLPAGEFAARDGRPGPGKTWSLSDAEGERLAAQITRTAQQSAFAIDFDHQTIRSEANGQPAPAAAFATRFEWRKGVGLFATDVAWTERAKAHIESGEYRYISPVIRFDAEGRITGVLMAAITNYPALLGMAPIGEQLCAVLTAQFTPDDPPETDMTIAAAIIAALGLKPLATEAEALTAIQALRTSAEAAGTKPAVPQALTAALGLAAGADEAAALSAVATLKAPKTDPAALATVVALQAEVAALTTRLNDEALNKVIVDGEAAMKVTPANKQMLIDIGKKDMAMLNAVIASLQVIPGKAGAQGGGGGAGNENTAALSAQELDVCARMGLTAEQFKKAAAA